MASRPTLVGGGQWAAGSLLDSSVTEDTMGPSEQSCPVLTRDLVVDGHREGSIPWLLRTVPCGYGLTAADILRCRVQTRDETERTRLKAAAQEALERVIQEVELAFDDGQYVSRSYLHAIQYPLVRQHFRQRGFLVEYCEAFGCCYIRWHRRRRWWDWWLGH
jgi:hypothetical protein